MYNNKQSYQTKNNTGSLFANKKRTKPNQPDYNGKVNVGGLEFYISGWKKVSPKSGETYLSLAFKVVENKDEGYAAQAPKGATNPFSKNNDLNDSIPF